jgi:hypothetical protein
MRYLTTTILIYALSAFVPIRTYAQGEVDQEAVRPIIENQRGDVDKVQQATWQVYPMKSKQALKAILDTIPGSYDLNSKIMIVELANRARLGNISGGKSLAIPSNFNDDYRAYSPYPFFYEAAKDFPKLFIIDKYTQTFGAYENGKLVHWGLVSTGRTNGMTPSGRYNFNWQIDFKLSNAAPEGETWKLYWVFNFYSKIGLHVHQYALPINKAVSHGCVRTARPDAEWNYSWANGWVQGGGDRVTKNGTPVLVINDNPPGNIAKHWQITGDGVQSLVRLPNDMYQYPRVEKLGGQWESGW